MLFSFLCLIPEVQQTCHLTFLVLLDECFQLLVITLFTIFLLACIQLFLNTNSQNYIQGRFHKYKDINVFLSLLEKKIYGDCACLLHSQNTLMDHNHPVSNWCCQLFLCLIYFQVMCFRKKESLVIEMLCDNNVAFYAIFNTLDLQVVQLFL